MRRCRRASRRLRRPRPFHSKAPASDRDAFVSLGNQRGGSQRLRRQSARPWRIACRHRTPIGLRGAVAITCIPSSARARPLVRRRPTVDRKRSVLPIDPRSAFTMDSRRRRRRARPWRPASATRRDRAHVAGILNVVDDQHERMCGRIETRDVGLGPAGNGDDGAWRSQRADGRHHGRGGGSRCRSLVPTAVPEAAESLPHRSRPSQRRRARSSRSPPAHRPRDEDRRGAAGPRSPSLRRDSGRRWDCAGW